MTDRSLHGMLIRGQIADEKSSLKRNMEKGKMSSNLLNHQDHAAVEPRLQIMNDVQYNQTRYHACRNIIIKQDTVRDLNADLKPLNAQNNLCMYESIL